jgi:hypothetical protein
VLVVFIQRGVTPPAGLVLQCGGIVVLGVDADPGVDRLPGDAEHAGDVSGGATLIELQDSQGLAVQAGIPGLCELTSEASPLPGSQIEPAHGFLLLTGAVHEQTACQIFFAGLLSVIRLLRISKAL